VCLGVDFHIREGEGRRECDRGGQGDGGSIRDSRGAGYGGCGGQGGCGGGRGRHCAGGGEGGCGGKMHSGLGRSYAGLSHCRSGEKGTGAEDPGEK